MNMQRKLSGPFIFLALYCGYIFLLLNQHFNIPLKFIPSILICIGLVLIWKSNTLVIQYFDFCKNSTSLNFFISLACLIFCFVIGTSTQLPKLGGFFDLWTIFISPLCLAVLGAIIFSGESSYQPLTKTIQVLCYACVASVLFLGFTDVLHYLRDFYRIGRVPDDYSHRWFADGYIFFLPWLLLNFVKAQTFSRRLLWLLAVFSIFILISGTASRASLGVTVIEICLFMAFYRRKPIAFILPLFLCAAYFIGASILAPTQVENLLARGVTYQSRIYDAWVPTLTFIHENPYFGRGFGLAIWDSSFATFLSQRANWPGINMGGPHNLILSVGFIGGYLGISFFVILSILIIWVLLRIVLRAPFEIAGPALATLCSYIDFYLVRGLVESPRFEPLAITILFTLLIRCAFQKFQSSPRNVEKS